jgi:hypothetical protein
MKSSNFLKKEDVEDGVTVTISGMSQENVAKQGAPEELRWCLHLHEFDKPMVCNSTNAQLLAKICGSEETDDWPGSKVVLYHDPSVSYGGKLVGGIRVRALPKAVAAPARAAAAATPGSGSFKLALKTRFKAHPDFGTKLTADSINGYLVQNYGAKLDALTEEAAKDALASFDVIVEAALDDIPF